MSTTNPVSERIAVTVIGGYLGSGKTTLVNHILRSARERIAVLVNDFGDINIDVDLIESRDENTIELTNGCICCSLVDGFAAALEQVRAMEPQPHRLVIEASGVSDPAQVAAFGHGPGLRMDAVIVMADAETVRDRINDGYVGQVVHQQLAAAHIIVLNKLDLVAADEAMTLQAWLGENYPDAFLTAVEHGFVAPAVLFDVADVDSAVEPAIALPSAEDHFHTWTIERDEPMNRADVDSLMAELPAKTARAKGFLWLEGSDGPMVLQRVGHRWTLRQIGSWRGAPGTRIVVIAERES